MWPIISQGKDCFAVDSCAIISAMLTKSIKRIVKRGLSLARPISIQRRISLGDAPFSIISDDCWGSEVYNEFQRPYNTPFIDTLVPLPDFIRLANDFRRIVTSPIRFVERSKWDAQWPDSRMGPIALLDDDVEIQFRHYKSQSEVLAKWNRRLARLDFDHVFFKMTGENNAFIKEEYAAFDKLETPRKIAFSRSSEPYKSCVWIPQNVYEVDGKKLYNVSTRYFDLVEWLKR